MIKNSQLEKEENTVFKTYPTGNKKGWVHQTGWAQSSALKIRDMTAATTTSQQLSGDPGLHRKARTEPQKRVSRGPTQGWLCVKNRLGERGKF